MADLDEQLISDDGLSELTTFAEWVLAWVLTKVNSVHLTVEEVALELGLTLDGEVLSGSDFASGLCDHVVTVPREMCDQAALHIKNLLARKKYFHDAHRCNHDTHSLTMRCQRSLNTIHETHTFALFFAERARCEVPMVERSATMLKTMHELIAPKCP